MKRLTLLLICLFVVKLATAQSLTPIQRKQVLARAESFKYYLIKYSSAKNDRNAGRYKDSLSNMFTSEGTHVIDFGEQYKGNVRDQSIETYLIKVDQEYNYDIVIRFTQGQLINCIDTLGGKSAVFVTEKCISRKGKVNVFSEVIQIALPDDEDNYNGYRIRAVLLAVDFKYDKENHYECANFIEVRTEDKEKLKIQEESDQLFYINKQYTHATEAYLYMADRYPMDDYPKLMLSRCKDSLGKDIFLKQAKKYLIEKQYARAINWYSGHIISFPNDTNNTLIADTIRHLRVISAEENYTINMAKALAGYKSRNFGDASYYYINALKFKPDDRVALDSLVHTRGKDIDYANNKIDSAIRIYKENKTDNAGAYFKILDEYGRYGTHIGTEQYLYMAYLIYNRNPLVLNSMHLEKNKDYKAYRKKCYDNLIAAYNQETNKVVRKKVKYFIEEIVN